MTENMISFINAFILPLISLYTYSKRGNKELFLTFENVCRYSVFLSVGSICNKAITTIIKAVFTVEISMNSSYYTAIGVFTFALLPIVFEIAKKHFSIRIEAKNEKK